jgi:hypothetical protein
MAIAVWNFSRLQDYDYKRYGIGRVEAIRVGSEFDSTSQVTFYRDHNANLESILARVSVMDFCRIKPEISGAEIIPDLEGNSLVFRHNPSLLNPKTAVLIGVNTAGLRDLHFNQVDNLLTDVLNVSDPESFIIPFGWRQISESYTSILSIMLAED